MRRLVFCLTAAAGLAASASADVVVFNDTFDLENGGAASLNYTGFANWTVGGGTVDLIGNGSFDFYPGNGLYVDLDGSTGDSGLLETTTTFNFLAGITYQLDFELGGSQRGDTNTVTLLVNVGLINELFVLNSADPLALVTRTFTPAVNTSGTISFENMGGDNVGLILDDVVLTELATVIPLPGAGAMGAMGLVLGAIAMRRRGGRMS
ncbi:MAG: hypothetical protein H7Y88_05990 [Phycisphaerales bacterium]|nr:hypothetical protein [Phycisphaerales bacterium]